MRDVKPIKVRYEGGVFKPLEKIDSIHERTLGEVYLEETSPRKSSVRSSQFFGLWKDRTDITDGASFTRELRSKARY
jgi:predicted DNA-binding antitoxin AbrB/MazE fold protein